MNSIVQSQLAVMFAEIAQRLGWPWESVAASGLLLIALAGEVILAMLLSRLLKAAELSSQRWDDAVVLALRSPMRLAWWLIILTLLVTLLPSLAFIRDVSLRILHASLVLLVPWFLHRLIAGIEEELIETRFSEGASAEKATVRSTARRASSSLP